MGCDNLTVALYLHHARQRPCLRMAIPVTVPVWMVYLGKFVKSAFRVWSAFLQSEDLIGCRYFSGEMEVRPWGCFFLFFIRSLRTDSGIVPPLYPFSSVRPRSLRLWAWDCNINWIRIGTVETVDVAVGRDENTWLLQHGCQPLQTQRYSIKSVEKGCVHCEGLMEEQSMTVWAELVGEIRLVPACMS